MTPTFLQYQRARLWHSRTVENGDLIAYVYHKSDETTFDYVTAADGGKTWSKHSGFQNELSR